MNRACALIDGAISGTREGDILADGTIDQLRDAAADGAKLHEAMARLDASEVERFLTAIARDPGLRDALQKLGRPARTALTRELLDVVGEETLAASAADLPAADKTKLLAIAAGALGTPASKAEEQTRAAVAALDAGPRHRIVAAAAETNVIELLRLARDTRGDTEQDLWLEIDDLMRRVAAAQVAARAT